MSEKSTNQGTLAIDRPIDRNIGRTIEHDWNILEPEPLDTRWLFETKTERVVQLAFWAVFIATVVGALAIFALPIWLFRG